MILDIFAVMVKKMWFTAPFAPHRLAFRTNVLRGICFDSYAVVGDMCFCPGRIEKFGGVLLLDGRQPQENIRNDPCTELNDDFVFNYCRLVLVSARK